MKAFWAGLCALALLPAAPAVQAQESLASLLLDSAFFILILMPFISANSRIKKVFKNVINFGIGGLLVPIYLAFNYFWFGSIITTSGAAKHLKPSFHLSLPTFNSIFNPSEPMALYVLPSAISSICVLFMFLFYKKYNCAYGKAIAPVLIFPMIYYPFLSMSSDWQLWHWYFYPIVIAAPISVAIILERFISKKMFKFVFNDKSIVGALICSLLIMWGVIQIFVVSIVDYSEKNTIYHAALKIKEFERTHSGRYAMGDRAGSVAYLIDSPIVQTEGLVMDKQFLLRRGDQASVASACGTKASGRPGVAARS